MDEANYVTLFSALAQEHRLAAFRLLMKEGPAGLPAGDIAKALDVPPSTLSAHLSQMCQAGLLQSNRRSQQIFYAINIEGTRRLIDYLTDDCCQGRPELCGYAQAPVCTPSTETVND